MFMSLSGPDPFVSKSGVQMVKEGNIILSSLKKRYTEPVAGVNLFSTSTSVDPQKCLSGHVCLLIQVATGEG